MRPRLSVTRSAVDLIKAFEGFRAKSAKLDDGGWTIGYGHTRTAREGVTISERDAEALLLYDLIGVAHAINELVFAPVSQNQFDALASFVFNIGERAFRTSPTLRRLNEGKPLEAALAMEVWRKSDLHGDRIIVDALVRRRAAEKALFLTPADGFVPAPTPVLPPKIDYDAMALVPLTTPIETRADLTGERAVAERADAPPPPAPAEAPSASATAAEAVIARLEALVAEPATAPPEIKPAEPTLEPAPIKPEPEVAVASTESRVKPVERLPNISFETAKPARRGLLGSLGLLFLLLVGVGLLALGVTFHLQSEYDRILGVAPHTAALGAAIAGVICFFVATYFILARIGLPRDR
jgi:lysozyme